MSPRLSDWLSDCAWTCSEASGRWSGRMIGCLSSPILLKTSPPDRVVTTHPEGVRAGRMPLRPGRSSMITPAYAADISGSFPQKAIVDIDNKLVINYRNCLRCFCCQEFSPLGNDNGGARMDAQRHTIIAEFVYKWDTGDYAGVSGAF